MIALTLPVLLPLFMALMALCIPASWHWLKKFWVVAGALGFAVASGFAGQNLHEVWQWGGVVLLRLTPVSRMGLYTAAFMAPLIVGASLGERNHVPHAGLLLSALSMGALILLGDHLALIVIAWGALAVILYLLVSRDSREAAEAAQKTLAVLGGTDALLIFGLALLVMPHGQFMLSKFTLVLDSPWQWLGFLSVLIAILAKVAAMPFHTWLPAMSVHAQGSVNAMLPATLDKLVGIYLLARLVQSAPVLPNALRLLLMGLGILSLLGGVMMALIQHDMRRLLAYHAVSQTGYMLLGIATGSLLGIAAALFHLINNVLYKSGLFLSAGAVETVAGHTHLKRLGGLSRTMPTGFVAFFIMALAISGIPPLNGFLSKWLIAQALVNGIQQNDWVYPLALIAALVGSGLTLASFLKLTYAVYLGPMDESLQKKVRHYKPGLVWLPVVLIAVACIVIGIAGLRWVLPQLLPLGATVRFNGLWAPESAALLLGMGIVAGLLVFVLAGSLKPRIVPSFNGGEKPRPKERILGTGFYLEVEQLPGIRTCYRYAQKQMLDLYEQGRRWVRKLAIPLQKAHNGHLNRYASWLIVGWLLLLAVMMGVWR